MAGGVKTTRGPASDQRTSSLMRMESLRSSIRAIVTFRNRFARHRLRSLLTIRTLHTSTAYISMYRWISTGRTRSS